MLVLAATLLVCCAQAQTSAMIWAKNLKYTVAGNRAKPADMVIDNAGNYYLTGTYEGILDMDPGPATRTISALGYEDMFIAKYDGDGNYIWAKSIGSSNTENGVGLHVVNNILYVTGSFIGTSLDVDPGPASYAVTGTGSFSSFLVTLDTSGVFQSAFSMPGCMFGAARTDNTGNLVIGGYYSGSSVDLDPGPGSYTLGANMQDLFYGKYTTTGSMIWVRTLSTAANDFVKDLTVSSSGLVVVGGSYNYNGYSEVADASGTVLKSGTFYVEAITAVETDAAGNIFYAGTYTGSNDLDWSPATYSLTANGTYRQGFVAKYTSSYALSWAKQLTTVLNYNNSNSENISIDNNGDVLVSFRETNAASNSWLSFAKLGSANGAAIWRNDLSGSCYNGANSNEGIAIGYRSQDGSVLVTGVIGGSSLGSSTPCSLDADPGPGVYNLNAGVGNTQNVDVFMGKYASCSGGPAALSVIGGNTTACAGAATVYSVSPASGASSYAWSLPGSWAGSSSTNTISVMPSASGVISVYALNSCGSSATQSLSVQVDPVPAQPSAISGAVALCAGAGLQTYSVAAVSSATSYSWSVPGGWSGSSTGNTIQLTPGTGGGVLSVTASNACGNSASRSLSLTVNALPSVSISGPVSVCSGNSATLAASGALTYTWNTSSTNAGITVSPASNTSYTVTGTDANGCINTAVKGLTVSALPSVTITGPSAICWARSATLMASGASTYTWSTTSTTTNSMSISPSSNTTYTVTGMDVNGCTNTATKTVTVNPLPSVSMNGPAALCSGNSATLTVSGANTYTWSTGANSSSVVISPTVNTSYTLTGTDLNGCENMAAQSVTVYALPSVVISGGTSICAGTTTTLSATGAVSYTWSTGTSSSSVAVSPTSGTTYSVTGLDANGCQGMAFANVGVVSSLPVTVNGPSMLCSGSSATLSAAGALTYTWSTGANTNSVSVSPTAFTIYTVTGTDANGCSGTAYKNITVVANPTLSVTGPSTVCAGASATIQVSGALSYTWSTGAHATSQVITPFADVTYYVYGTDNNGCMGGATKSMTVSPHPPLVISGLSSVCSGNNISLTASGAATYTWSTGSNNGSITVSPSVNTTYTLSGTGVNTCSYTVIKTIVVNAQPTVAISGPTLICKGNTATLTATGASNYVWNASATDATLAVSPSSTSSYTVRGTDLNGCSKTASFTLSVSPCTGLESLSPEDLLVYLYPNPARSEVNIHSSEMIRSILLLDLTGRIVFAGDKPDRDHVIINLDHYSSGIYHLLIRTDRQTKQLRLVKE